MRVLFLDIDGVLNRTGYRPATSLGLRSWIEPELAARLNRVLLTIGARIVLSSDWRKGRDLELLRQELSAAGVDGELFAVTPVIPGAGRWREIEAWMDQWDVAAEDVAIVDDGYEMGPLGPRFVRASPLNGFDDAVADTLVALFARM